MKKQIQLTIIMFISFVLSGCYTTGLSVRENGHYNYSNVIYSLYDIPSQEPRGKAELNFPLKIAVAQVGETGAPEYMIRALKEEKGLVAEVMTIPATKVDFNLDNSADDPDSISMQIDRMQRLSQDLGADYLFIFGGAADYETSSNALSMFDITIVGAYLLPSQRHTAEGKASGALVDVRTGQIAFIVNSEAKSQTYTPSYFEYYGYQGNANATGALLELREDLVEKLTKNLIASLKEKS